LGCFRSREERTHWLAIDDATKRIIVQACTRRKRAFLAKQRKQTESETHFNQGSLF
jgi:predicted Fe-S protein YdhL (DUF1289 family)